eukprot:scaffold65253_cov54-Phaeocystis_antarctica.AAC.1
MDRLVRSESGSDTEPSVSVGTRFCTWSILARGAKTGVLGITARLTVCQTVRIRRSILARSREMRRLARSREKRR